jgi:hypothetical protein
MEAPVSGDIDDASTRRAVDVTYRFDGRERTLLATGVDIDNAVATNTEEVAPINSTVNRIATNADNLTDTWVLHGSDLSEEHLRMVRIDP